MDREILEPLFDTIELHTKKINSLDTATKTHNKDLVALRRELDKELAQVSKDVLAQIPKPEKVEAKADYGLISRLLQDDLDKLISKHDMAVRDTKDSLSKHVDTLVTPAVIAYIDSIKATLVGKEGKAGKDGKNGVGIQGKQGVQGVQGKAGKDGKVVKPVSEASIKKLVKEEVSKIPKPYIPVAPVSAPGLSLIKVQQEIDSSIADSGHITSGDLDGNTLDASLVDVSVSGSFVRTTANITTTSSITASNFINFINASSNITITLPTAIGKDGIEFNLKRIDATNYTVTVVTTGGQTIDSDTTFTLEPYENIALISNNTNWYVI